MKYKKIIFVVLILSLIKTKISALGSLDTTLSGTDKTQFINVAWTFDSGAYAKGYVTFNKGFSLGSNMSFGCNGIISGDIKLNNHTLTLTSDLYLGKNARIVGPGSINPATYSMYLLDVEAVVGGTVNVVSNGTIVGNGNYLSLESGGAINFTTGWQEGSLHNLFIRNANHTSFTTNNSLGYFTNLDSVSFEISTNDYIDLNWNVKIWGHCQIMGEGARLNSCGTTHITTASSLEVMPNTTFRICPSHGGIFFLDPTSEFMLDNATLEFNWWAGSYINTMGRFVVNGFSTIRSLIGDIIYFGDGASATNDPNIVIYPGSNLFIDNRTTVKYQCIK